MIVPPQLTHQLAQYVCETDAFCKLLMSCGLSYMNAHVRRAIECVIEDDAPNLLAWMHHNARHSLDFYNHVILKFAAHEASCSMLQDIVRMCMHNDTIETTETQDKSILKARRTIINRARALDKTFERNKLCVFTRALILEYV
jgi:hypothetical protein